MDPQIVRTEDENFDGLVKRYIFGLNLLPDAHPRQASIDDPTLIFLRELTRQQSVGALIDKASDHVRDSDPLLAHLSYTELPVGVIGGEFAVHSSLAEGGSLFFPKIDDHFFEITYTGANGAIKSLMFGVLYQDCLALLISPLFQDASHRLFELLSQPASEDFTRKAVEIYGVVLTSGADGDFFECYAKDASKFDMLNRPLDTAVNTIEESDWFQKSKNDLVWDDQLSMCLMEKDKLPQ
jgi:hypothetical protein